MDSERGGVGVAMSRRMSRSQNMAHRRRRQEKAAKDFWSITAAPAKWGRPNGRNLAKLAKANAELATIRDARRGERVERKAQGKADRKPFRPPVWTAIAALWGRSSVPVRVLMVLASPFALALYAIALPIDMAIGLIRMRP